jgi:Protein of unknown function (DUF2586)
MFKGPEIGKADGALGAKAGSEENILALVCGGVATANIALGASKKLTQPSDADDLLLTAAYDSTNKVLVRYHIDEFFILNPNGVLWLMLVAQGTTMAAMCNKNNAYANKLIMDSARKVKHIGVVLNPATGYVATITDGVDADVSAATLKAQELCDTWKLSNVFIDMVVIEGRQLTGASGSWKDNRIMESPNVHVAVLQDKDVANLDALYAKHAAVGTVLGGLGVRRVEEDLGSSNSENNPNKGAANMPINDAANGRWINPAISSGTLCNDLSPADVKALQDKAYVFADSYPEYPGVYFSGSPACTSLSSDFAYGVNTRVWNKAARIVVFKLTPKINGKVALVGGKISVSTASYWEQDINNTRDGLGAMVVADNATKSQVKLDANQDVQAASKVVVKMSVTPYGYSRVIEAELGFSL